MHSVSYLSGPITDRIKQITQSAPVVKVTASGDTLLPGAGFLPPSVGAKFTIRNATVGAAVVVGLYMAYSLFKMPPRKAKPAAAPASAAAAVAGLFGVKYRHRRR